tara:strand:- start:3174 stop:3344 length:171 start_codon:yes stop_codon:yes gene_type:complete
LKTLTQENERLNKEIINVNTRLLEERMDKRNLEEIMQQNQKKKKIYREKYKNIENS